MFPVVRPCDAFCFRAIVYRFLAESYQSIGDLEFIRFHKIRVCGS